MGKVKLTGVAMATLVGLLFAAEPLLAAESSQPTSATVKCLSGNSCAGQSACKSFDHSCKGQNSCKGKGFVMTSTAAACQQKGGHVEKN